MKRRVNGNITVYMGVVTGLILTLVFSLIEVTHFRSLGQEKDILSQAAAEGVMAQYNRPLWKDYRILAVDGGFGSSSFSEEAIGAEAMKCAQANSHNSLLSLQPTEVAIKNDTLLSDWDGATFLKEASLAQRYEVPVDLLDAGSALCGQMESDAAGEGNMSDVLTQAQNSLDEAESIKEEAAEDTASEETAQVEVPTDPPENPILTMQEWKAKGVLAQVLSQDVTLSGATISAERPSNRSLQQGRGEVVSIDASDRVLYGLYFQNHFQSFTNPMQHDGLAYEWEYIINGKTSDEENLKATVEKLLLLREVQNFLAIQKIESCQLTAEATAMALVGFTGNPAIIKGVKQGILAAWAYMESVLDVRALLAGKKVPLLKTASNWTSDVTNIGACLEIHNQAKEDPKGISYEAYLLGFTYMTPVKEVGQHCLDVVEAGIRSTPGYENVRIDHMVARVTFDFSYEGYPTFASLIGAGHRIGTYHFQKEWESSYYK